MKQLATTEVTKRHNRKDFDCGTPALNDYLGKNARQHSDRDISRTYLLYDPNTPTQIIGYYTIIFADVEAPPGSPLSSYPHPVASIRLARLAIDKRYQGQGIGGGLLMSVLEKACLAYEVAPIIGVFVDAKHQSAKDFYSKYGFDVANEQGDEYCLWLSMGTILKLFA